MYEDYTHYIEKLRVFDSIAKMTVRKISIGYGPEKSDLEDVGKEFEIHV